MDNNQQGKEGGTEQVASATPVTEAAGPQAFRRAERSRRSFSGRRFRSGLPCRAPGPRTGCRGIQAPRGRGPSWIGRASRGRRTGGCSRTRWPR